MTEDYRALHQHAGFIERAELGRLRLRGADRRSYLHGILTNDIAGLSAGESCYAALLTAQGRMITDMQVFELDDETLLTLPAALAAGIRDRLDQYIFSEDVQVEDATQATIQYGVYGPAARQIAAQTAFVPAPLILPSTDFGIEGVEVIGLRSQGSELERAFADARAVPVAVSTLEQCRIEAGIPKFMVDMTADTIPLEAGIEERAISMTKGCYPGQEIIIRVLHRGGGRVAKKLVGLLLEEGSRVPQAGETVRAGDREIGTVTSAVHSPRFARPIALGYVHRDYVAAGTAIVVGDSRGEVSALPFQPSASADLAP